MPIDMPIHCMFCGSQFNLESRAGSLSRHICERCAESHGYSICKGCDSYENNEMMKEGYCPMCDHMRSESIHECCVCHSPEKATYKVNAGWTEQWACIDCAERAGYHLCSVCNTFKSKIFSLDNKIVCRDCARNLPEYTACDYCSKLILKSSSVNVDGSRLCADCLNETTFVCRDCGERHHNRVARYSHGTALCQSCVRANYFRCEACGEFMHNDERNTVHDGRTGEDCVICNDCTEERTTCCDRCGITMFCGIHREDGCLCYECNRRYPPAQRRALLSNWCPPDGVTSYSFKPMPIFLPKFNDSSIYFGYELEAENSGFDRCEMNEYADHINAATGYTYVKHDGSLDNGLEIVSHPATIAYHCIEKGDVYKKLFENMISDGFRSHDVNSCGLHVHMSLAPMERKDPLIVGKLLYAFSDHWAKLVKFSRRTESSLDRWAALYRAKEQVEGMKQRNYCDTNAMFKAVENSAKSEGNRYFALNLCNMHTIEIRMFKGTLLWSSFFASLQLCDVIVNRLMDTPVEDVQNMPWSTLVASDYKELNDYLSLRNLV